MKFLGIRLVTLVLVKKIPKLRAYHSAVALEIDATACNLLIHARPGYLTLFTLAAPGTLFP